jgi:hypothetical protein
MSPDDVCSGRRFWSFAENTWASGSCNQCNQLSKPDVHKHCDPFLRIRCQLIL